MRVWGRDDYEAVDRFRALPPSFLAESVLLDQRNICASRDSARILGYPQRHSFAAHRTTRNIRASKFVT